jgi:hypothetical protein
MKLKRIKGMQASIRGLGLRPPWGAIWALIGIVILWHCWFASYNHDEIEHLHASWLISIGQLPYRDFLEQHHPTLWFLAAPLVARFDSVRWLVFAARLLDGLCLVTVLWLVKRLMRRLYPELPWQFPTLLLLASFTFVRSTLEFRPDPLMNVAVYAGILHWIVFLQEGKFRRAAAAAVFFGLAMVMLQKAAVILALVCTSALLLVAIRLWRRERVDALARGLAILLIAGAISTSALFLAMRSLGVLDEFWFWNYSFNRFFYMQADLRQHFSLPRTIGVSALLDPVLWIAGGMGAYLCAKELLHQSRLSAHDECRLTLLCLGFGYLGFLLANRFPFDQYLIVFLPLLAIFAAEALRSRRPKWQTSVLWHSALLMPFLLIGVLLFYPNNRAQRSLQDFLLQKTSADQSIFVPPAFNPIFRRDAAYFWYNSALISGAYRDYCRRNQGCPSNKLALDEHRWKTTPPAFVFLELPAYYPYRWKSRESAYSPTEMPRLWSVRPDR